MARVIRSGERKVFIGDNRLLLGIVLSMLTYWLFAQSLYNVVPAVQHSLPVSPGTLSLAISLSGLFAGCFIVLCGGLADRLGRRRLSYIGLLLSLVGCGILVLAQNGAHLLVARALQGISAACIMPATLALIKVYYQGARARQRALSFYVMGSFVGSALSSLLGGAIAAVLGWRGIFLVSAMVALLAMGLIRHVPESRNDGEAPALDYAGAAFLTLSLLALNLTLSKGGEWGWLSGATLLGVLLTGGLLALFITTERRLGSRGFVDFSLYRDRGYRAASLSNFFVNCNVSTLVIASLYLQRGLGMTALAAGLMTITYAAAAVAMVRVGEKLLQRIGARLPMLWGCVLIAVGTVLMTMTFLPKSSYLLGLGIGYLLLGIGIGAYATPSTETAIAQVAKERVGVAAGLYKMTSALGGAFGIAVALALFSAAGASDAANLAYAGALPLWVNVAFSLLAGGVVLWQLPPSAVSSSSSSA
ncbi:MFS domain-containing protein [Edwardsiella anguillarum]|uniref:MFS transporter n=1 Tax=Edwardsiella TaxID=635 RepID=UPI00045CD221|nr:MFS transporter [Edwardsiella anguillarum]AKM47447.1 hypothetical protein QY76_08975 [Edwardsiella sp. EA181011]GAJ66123.1 hypothetical protein MA13_contig00001-0246 [Edwardsiella piscicida]RFT02328.1 MFS transporter [Edwardsiella anguillarum]BET81294.1 MFS domain-containing protein [Edwardsiella anguillarum]BET84721.1 MFS domain-containing protein [Edwardsiella anguillarum]